MALRHIVSVTLVLLLLASTARAQEATAAAPPPAAAPSSVDLTRLPINVSRIQRQLQQSQVRDNSQGLNIRYIVDVYGRAPRIDILTKADNLIYGPVPYGAPTHKEILQVITPQEYRAPAMDFGALMRWLKDKSK